MNNNLAIWSHCLKTFHEQALCALFDPHLLEIIANNENSIRALMAKVLEQASLQPLHQSCILKSFVFKYGPNSASFCLF